MNVKYSTLGTRWLVMDIRSLDLPDTSVDIAIDKGALDVMIHGSVWEPPEDVRTNVGQYVNEVARVLKPGGQWLYITYRQPHFMKPLLTREGLWTVSAEELRDPEGGASFGYFGFVMKKNEHENDRIVVLDGDS
jgi:ubiquinone/menaquinone biosynthesis C-methylase UbiE